MKFKTVLIALAIVAMTVAAVSASWANSLTFQGVTFTENITGGGSTLTLTVSSATGATGDWATANGFAAFSVKDVGSATGLALTGWTAFGNELNANGCAGGLSTGNTCFVRNAGPIAITPGAAFGPFTFNITKSAGTFDLSDNTLKVIFTVGGTTNTETGAVTGKVGSLLSTNIPGTVPEPTSLILLGAGLAGIGIWRRKAIKA